MNPIRTLRGTLRERLCPTVQHLLALTVGMNEAELRKIMELGAGLPAGGTAVHIGVWKGASVIACMSHAGCSTHVCIDCFDMPGVSAFSGNTPARLDSTAANLLPWIHETQEVQIVRANTLYLPVFPDADLYIIDAGHTEECVKNDSRKAIDGMRPGAVIAWHDYDQPAWPDVKPTVDGLLPDGLTEIVGTLAIWRT